MYEPTAEARGARMTNMWWLFFLTYTKFINNERGGIEDYQPVFHGKNFDQKSQAYEIAEQLGWKSPDYIVCPVGCGTNLSAICWTVYTNIQIFS